MNYKKYILTILSILILPSIVMAGNLSELGLEYSYDQTNWIQATGNYEEGFNVYLDKSKGDAWVNFRLKGDYTGETLKFTHEDYYLDNPGNTYGLNNDSDVVFWISEEGQLEDRFCKFTEFCSANPNNYLRMRADLDTPGVYVDYGITTFKEKDSDKEVKINIQTLADKPEEVQETKSSGGGISLTKLAYDKYGEELAQVLFGLIKEYDDQKTKLFYWENSGVVDFTVLDSDVNGIKTYKNIKSYDMNEFYGGI